MARAWSICPRCPEPVPTAGMCHACKAKAERARRPDGNPYSTTEHRIGFREQVLARNPICVECRVKRSTVADHHPTERRDLVTQGLNPNDPQYGRGLCERCHNKHTAATSPGGWAAGVSHN